MPGRKSLVLGQDWVRDWRKDGSMDDLVALHLHLHALFTLSWGNTHDLSPHPSHPQPRGEVVTPDGGHEGRREVHDTDEHTRAPRP